LEKYIQKVFEANLYAIMGMELVKSGFTIKSKRIDAMAYDPQTSHCTGLSIFASRTSPSTDQSLQKSFHLSNADKIELKKISSSENKKYSTAQPGTTKTEKRSIDNGLQGRGTEGLLITAPTKK
jgi:hypothetical protein